MAWILVTAAVFLSPLITLSILLAWQRRDRRRRGVEGRSEHPVDARRLSDVFE